MVFLGILNSRMKDFYDIWIMSKSFSFEGPTLVRAIEATFDCRRTAIPNNTPTALSDEFATNQDKASQWKALFTRNQLKSTAIDLPLAIDDLRTFLIPLLLAAAKGNYFPQIWRAGGPWAWNT